ncbi:MAG: hypothetical protein M9890_14670 [Thermomicrobiales bacterium]|nr:hypothetical protein [Thermomicrobiales bacterium]
MKLRLGHLPRKAIILLLLLIAPVATAAISAADEQPAWQGWPPFQMTYKEFGHTHGAAAPPTTNIWTLTWHSLGQWQRELVTSEANPQAESETYQFDGQQFTVDLALPGAEDIVIDHTDGVPVMPTFWLVPGRDASLARIGFQKSAEPATDLVQYQRDAPVPCTTADPSKLPASCETGSTFIRTETIIYTTAITHPMPVLLVDEIDGQVSSRIAVLTVEALQ